MVKIVKYVWLHNNCFPWSQSSWAHICFLLFSDLVRRVCDKTEKDFLREKGVVSETQSDLGNINIG